MNESCLTLLGDGHVLGLVLLVLLRQEQPPRAQLVVVEYVGRQAVGAAHLWVVRVGRARRSLQLHPALQHPERQRAVQLAAAAHLQLVSFT